MKSKYLIKWVTLECEDEYHYEILHTRVFNFTDEELNTFTKHRRIKDVILI